VRGGLARSGAGSPGYRDLERTFVDGTLGSFNSLLVSLRALPGRKTVVVFSEGIALRVDQQGWLAQPIEGRLNRLAQLAAEGGVTTHTVDVTGVSGALSTPQLADQMDLRDGLDNLARRMAGLYLHNANDLLEPLRRIAAVEKGYYLLSYAPPDGTFVRARNAPFRKLSVTVRQPGLVVHTRAGFFGRRSAD
jgi:VWFA-related protein